MGEPGTLELSTTGSFDAFEHTDRTSLALRSGTEIPEGPDPTRPSIVPPALDDPRAPAGVAAFLLLVVAWIFLPFWPDLGSQVLGAPETDTIRGMWSMDHVSRSLWWPDSPIRSFELAFPTGVWAVMLPFASSLLLAPLQLLLGPKLAWNLALIAMIWATGFATAWLCRIVSGSWVAATLAGAAVASQPMLLHAMGDGTPEHVAFWSVPVVLGLTAAALQRRSWRWALLAGTAAMIVALDSPYQAVYSGVIGLIAMPWLALRLRRDQLRALGTTVLALAGATLLAGLIVWSVYRNFPQITGGSGPQPELWRMNAADIHTWWQYDWGPAAARDPDLTPTYIPSVLLGLAVVLGLMGGARGLPWLAAGTACLILSFGLNTRIPGELSRWLGETGTGIGHLLLGFNAYAYALPGIEGIRFPWRWLVPAALCFMVAASVGGARLGRRFPRVAPAGFAILGLACAVYSTSSSGLHTGFPAHTLPRISFAEWIAQRPGDGAVTYIPRMRMAPAAEAKRDEHAVFANIEGPLSSAELEYFQVLHRRPVTSSPNLKTLVVRPAHPGIEELLQAWDDLTQPKQLGKPIPRGSIEPPEPEQRAAALELLHAAGLRWIVLDLAVFDDEGIEVLLDGLGERVTVQERFEDGDGVLVIELVER